MQIMIIHCHTANRGDEAAVRALIDELNLLYDNLSIVIAIRGKTEYPNLPSNVKTIKQFMPSDWKSMLAYYAAKYSCGKIRVSKSGKKFLDEVHASDFIVHAPGGPSLGDTYYESEASYLRIYMLLKVMKKKYMFYAPSMGPFHRTERNKWRKSVLQNAECIVLRDPVSAEYVKELLPEIHIYQTLDSAFQNEIDLDDNISKLCSYTELNEFLNAHKRCIGITVTDLLWHPVHSKTPMIEETIVEAFTEFIKRRTGQGEGIIFIPQLYGEGNDFDFMSKFIFDKKDCFILPADCDEWDSYFQQYLIGKLYAVIGMRYHSNIFSAKMGTPFISIAYEQKMSGFMQKMKLTKFCISLSELSSDELEKRFLLLSREYESYRQYLYESHDKMRLEAYKTTELLKNSIDKVLYGKRGRND